MRTMPPPEPEAQAARSAMIRRASRHRYARPIKDVEAAIAAAFER